MMIESLAVDPTQAMQASPGNRTHSLVERMRAGLDTPTKEEPDPRELMDAFVRRVFANEFLQAMLIEDEEKTGVKPEPWY